jgi:hypothetical protein
LLPIGAVAQLGERVVRNDEVVGSIPISSTIIKLFTSFLAGSDYLGKIVIVVKITTNKGCIIILAKLIIHSGSVNKIGE